MPRVPIPLEVRLLAVAVVGLALVGCAQVEAGPEHVTIQHLAFQPLFADMEADRHCAEYGRKAVKVRTGPIKPGPLAVQTRVSEYDCVPKGNETGKAD